MVDKKKNVSDKRVSKLRTICEVHREIYDIINESDINIKLSNILIEKLNEVYGMGKKMDNKLRQYKYNYDDNWLEGNKNFKKSLFKRKGRK